MREHARHFDRKIDARHWLDGIVASQQRGDYVDPKLVEMTVDDWCTMWLAG